MKRIVLFALFIAIRAFALTPAEKAVQQAEAKIAQQPSYAPYYNQLAMAYARRARETSDTMFYSKAEETLTKLFAIEPDNFEGLKTQAWLQLGRHEFANARVSALKLNTIAPDDITVYGYLVDANAELGNYQEAVDAAQWMLNLRPGNTAGLVRAAYLRELHGNLDGALELMQMAFDSESMSETEDRAWLMTQMAHLEIVAGDLKKAETYAQNALSMFPDYHYALAALAQVRISQHHYEEATRLLEKRYNEAPHAENLYALAEAEELAGDNENAAASFQRFEKESLAESGMADNSNRELIFYYLEHAHAPSKALEIAQKEFSRRHDVYTLDAYASALAANGRHNEATVQMQRALSTGIKDPKILAHAAAIASHPDSHAAL